MNNVNLKYIALITFLFSGLFLSAQEGAEYNPELDSEVDIYGHRSLVVKDANKMNPRPELKDKKSEKPEIKYSMVPNKQEVSIKPNQLAPAKILVEDPLRKLYRGYAAAGFGLYTSPFAEFSYTSGRSRDLTWGLRGSHFSSKGSVAVDDSIPSAFSDNHVGFWAEKLIKKHAVSFGGDYNRNVVNRYAEPYEGFDEYAIDNLENVYKDLSFSAGLRSYFRDSSDVNYRGNIDYHHFSNNYTEKEHNFKLSAYAQKYIDSELFSADFGIQYNQFDRFSSVDQMQDKKDNFIVHLQPMAGIIRKDWEIRLGMGLYVDARSESTFHFYPIAHAQYSLFEDLIVPYVGVKGELKQNTYRSLSSENAFVVRDPELINTNDKFELYGGIRGAISSKVSYTTSLSIQRFENFAYFISDSIFDSGQAFTVIYDDLTRTNLSAELALSGDEKLDVFLRGDYFIYGEGNEEFAWHQPNLKFSALAKYKLREKFIVDAELYYLGKRKAKSLLSQDMIANGSEEVTELKGFLDFNLGVEYRYTKRISVWAKMSNVFAAQYQQWNNYPVQRFQAMMGAAYAF